jgi:hypothetical protein
VSDVLGALGALGAGYALARAGDIKRIKQVIGEAFDEALSKKLDIHSTFQWEHFLEQGINAHFITRTADLKGSSILIKASDFWKQVDYKPPFEGTLTLPKDKMLVAIYSRRAFMYPNLIANVKLPSLSLVGDETHMYLYLGLENGNSIYNGIASFLLDTYTTYTNRLFVVAGPLTGVSQLNIDVAKPADFNTAYHIYRVILTKNLVLFFIDGRLRAVAVQSLQGGYVKVKENVLPYSITLISPMPSSMTTLIELYAFGRSSIASADAVAPLSPFRFRVSDGKDIIPLALPLYLDNTDTALADYSISSGSITSHPIPVFGYSEKTIYFMASQSGTLNIEVYTLSGNWRTYDSISIPANTFYAYKMTGDAVLARVKFTPNTYPATINEAGVVLNG